jgi:hypothetical protein
MSASNIPLHTFTGPSQHRLRHPQPRARQPATSTRPTGRAALNRIARRRQRPQRPQRTTGALQSWHISTLASSRTIRLFRFPMIVVS